MFLTNSPACNEPPILLIYLKGTKRQHCYRMGKKFGEKKTETIIKIQSVRPTETCGEVYTMETAYTYQKIIVIDKTNVIGVYH